MLSEHLTEYKSQLESLSALEHLTARNGLHSFFDAFLLSCRVDGLSKRTLEYYQEKVGPFIKLCDGLGIPEPSEITPSHIRLFLLKVQETNNPVSVHDFYRAVKRFFNWMVTERMIAYSPMASVRSPRVPQKVVVPFTIGQVRDLLLLCDQRRFVGARNRAIILMFLDTGLRLTELASIQIADIDLDQETIRVMGKGSRERIVRIGKQTQKALLRYLLMRTDHYPSLWVGERAKALDAHAIQSMLRRLGKRAGLSEVRCSPHTFRHTFATMAIRNGANLFYVQSLLGHSTLTMTRRYAKTVDSEAAVKAHPSFSPVDRGIEW